MYHTTERSNQIHHQPFNSQVNVAPSKSSLPFHRSLNRSSRALLPIPSTHRPSRIRSEPRTSPTSSPSGASSTTDPPTHAPTAQNGQQTPRHPPAPCAHTLLAICLAPRPPHIHHHPLAKRNLQPSPARLPSRAARAQADFARARRPSGDERRVFARGHYEAEEAQFGREEGREGSVEQWEGYYGVYSG